MTYEIWLGEHWSHYGCGIAHLDDGSNKDLAAWLHTATFGADTVLIAEEDRYMEMDFPVRWHAKENSLSFYDWEPHIESIIFHNDSGRSLEIIRFGVLEAGGTEELKRRDLIG